MLFLLIFIRKYLEGGVSDFKIGDKVKELRKL